MWTDSDQKALNLSRRLRSVTDQIEKDLGRSPFKADEQMIRKTIDALRIKAGSRILELGPTGDPRFDSFFDRDLDRRYFGFSAPRKRGVENRLANAKDVSARKVFLDAHEGTRLPYTSRFFHGILSVNTIYFWKRPTIVLREIHRVLRPGGVCAISFYDIKGMKKLSLADPMPEGYDIQKIVQLVLQTSFGNVDIQTHDANTVDKAGKRVECPYLVATLTKS